ETQRVAVLDIQDALVDERAAVVVVAAGQDQRAGQLLGQAEDVGPVNDAAGGGDGERAAGVHAERGVGVERDDAGIGVGVAVVPTTVSWPADRPFWMVWVPPAARLVGPDSCTCPVQTDWPLTARRPPELAGTSDR